jgi:hypothetical protein
MPSSFAAVPPRIATRWSSPSAAPARCAIRCRGEEPGRFPRRGRVELGTHRRYRRRPRPLRAPPRLSVPGQEHRRKLAGHSRRGGRRRPIYRRVDLRHEPFGLARRRRNQRFHPGTGGHRQRGGSGRQLHAVELAQIYASASWSDEASRGSRISPPVRAVSDPTSRASWPPKAGTSAPGWAARSVTLASKPRQGSPGSRTASGRRPAAWMPKRGRHHPEKLGSIAPLPARPQLAARPAVA